MKTLATSVMATLLVCGSLLTGCLTPAKFDIAVADNIALRSPKKIKTNEYVSVTSPLLTGNDQVSESIRTRKVLPLVVYWRFDEIFTCTLNPKIPIDNFTSAIFSAANKSLKEKLAGKKLELVVEKVPNVFSMRDRTHLVMVAMYPVHWSTVALLTENTDLTVAYKLLEGGVEAKQGRITIPYAKDKNYLGFFQSWQKGVSEHLGQYETNIAAMSKSFIDALAKEL